MVTSLSVTEPSTRREMVVCIDQSSDEKRNAELGPAQAANVKHTSADTHVPYHYERNKLCHVGRSR